MNLVKHNQKLQTFTDNVASVLHENFIGMYVAGSFVMGAWNETTSDIDIIVVTKQPLSDKEISRLIPMHAQAAGDSTLSKLEGEYIDLASLQTLAFTNLMVANIDNGALLLNTACKLSADNILCLLQCGKVLAGAAIDKLRLSVSDEQYKNALYKMLLEEKEEINSTNDAAKLYESLINSLRCIYGIETGLLPTKDQAIEHCKELLENELYQKIIDYRKGSSPYFEIDKKKILAIADYGLNVYDKNHIES